MSNNSAAASFGLTEGQLMTLALALQDEASGHKTLPTKLSQGFDSEQTWERAVKAEAIDSTSDDTER